MGFFSKRTKLEDIINEDRCGCNQPPLGASGGTPVVLPMPAKTLKGNKQSSPANPQDLTESEVYELLKLVKISIDGTDQHTGNTSSVNFEGFDVSYNPTTKVRKVKMPAVSSNTSGDLLYVSNGAIIVASGPGVTFTRTSASVWTFNIPAGVILKSHDIYSTAGENPGANVTINYNYTGNTVTNQGLSTARRPVYIASNQGATLTNDFVTGGSATTNFRPSINTVGGGNISMLIQTGTAFSGTTEPTNIKGIF